VRPDLIPGILPFVRIAMKVSAASSVSVPAHLFGKHAGRLGRSTKMSGNKVAAPAPLPWACTRPYAPAHVRTRQ